MQQNMCITKKASQQLIFSPHQQVIIMMIVILHVIIKLISIMLNVSRGWRVVVRRWLIIVNQLFKNQSNIGSHPPAVRPKLNTSCLFKLLIGFLILNARDFLHIHLEPQTYIMDEKCLNLKITQNCKFLYTLSHSWLVNSLLMNRWSVNSCFVNSCFVNNWERNYSKGFWGDIFGVGG